jgi:Ser/Thr protein kinase RdoA (MazF antagonist)
MLMPEIPGRDLYGADTAELLEMVSLLVDLQARRLGHETELLDLGLVDWRSRALIAAVTSVIQRTASQLDAGERAVLAVFAGELPNRMARAEACGIPETLMHSDFHPGNVRGSKGAMTFLDWGEAGVGHPLLDQAAMFGSIAADQVETVRAHWSECWRSVMPGCDPLAAFALLAPVAVARQAAIYQTFLDNIEPSEHPYHRGDPADRLRRVASLAREEPPL